ncbi:nitrogen regulation protein NR(I), partial [Xanthomonadaceae bacterium JHOS43]|nr:nitrogen regulation protein NR(I) [Xanthomonadaceae bacterium JHOS43]
REDIPALARQFIADAARRIQATPKQFAPATMDGLRRHPWPGNVRELENLCWRLMALAPGDTILLSDLPQCLSPGNPDPASVSTDQGDASSHDWERALRHWAEG